MIFSCVLIETIPEPIQRSQLSVELEVHNGHVPVLDMEHNSAATLVWSCVLSIHTMCALVETTCWEGND